MIFKRSAMDQRFAGGIPDRLADNCTDLGRYISHEALDSIHGTSLILMT